MKRKATSILLATISLIIYCCNSILAQTAPPVIKWQRTYGGTNNEEFRGMELTRDNGFIAVGLSESSNGDVSQNLGHSDYWIVRCDSPGNILWQKVYGGSGNDWGRSISKTSDSGYIVSGHSQSNNGNVTGNHGGYDFWILKLDSNGNINWKNCYGGSAFDNAYRAIQVSDGNYLVVGFTESNNGQVSGFHGAQDYWILKLDPDGNILWTKTMGGSGQEQASCVIETPDHDYVIAGYSHSSDGDVTDHIGLKDMWVVKLSQSGNVIWKKSYGGTKDDGARWLTLAPDGNYIICGFSASSNHDVTFNHGSYDYWIVKLDTNGNVLWQNSPGGSDYEYSYYIEQDHDGNYLVSGYTFSNDGDVTGGHGSGDYWLVKVDSLGNFLWQKTFGGSLGDECRVALVKENGNYLHAGFTNCTDGDVTNNHGGEDAWIVEACSLPAAVITNGSTVNSCKGKTVALTAATGAGYTYQWNKNGNLVNGATSSSYQYTGSATASFTVKVTSSAGCNATSATTTINKFAKPAASITPLGDLNICTTGQVTLQANSGAGYKYKWNKNGVKIPGATMQTYTATATGNYTVKVTDSIGCSRTSAAAVAYSSCKLAENNSGPELSLFPNPSDGNFVLTVSSDQQNQTAGITLIDLVGKVIMRKTFPITLGRSSISFDLGETIAEGIYFLQVEIGGYIKIIRVSL